MNQGRICNKSQYIAVFQPEKEGGFSVTVPTLPGCVSQGDTFERALENIKEAIELYMEDFDSQDFHFDREAFTVPVLITA